MERITPKLINQWKTRRLKENKLGTIGIDLRILSKMFNLAVREWEWCKENPVSRVSIGKLHNEVDRWLTYEEEAKLLAELPAWFQDIVLFALNTGMRQDEIFSLKWAEVNLTSRTVTVLKSKNYGKRTIPLNDVTLNILSRKAKVRAMSGLVFPDPRTGQKIVSQNVIWRYYAAQKRAGIPHVRFHDLRHTFATRLVQNGTDLYRVSKLLGHRDISTTQRYAHHYPESLREGVEALDDFYERNREGFHDSFTLQRASQSN